MPQAVQLGDRLARALGRRGQAKRVLLEHAPGLGERHGPAPAQEQGLAQLALELAHVLGDRRLGEVDPLGRPAEAPLAGDGEEHVHLAQGHRELPILSIRTTYWTL